MQTSSLPKKDCKFLFFSRQSWSLSSEGSLKFDTYRGTGRPIIMIISENPCHSHLLASVYQKSYHYLFYDCRGWDSNTKPSACEANVLTYCATAAVLSLLEEIQDRTSPFQVEFTAKQIRTITNLFFSFKLTQGTTHSCVKIHNCSAEKTSR